MCVVRALGMPVFATMDKLPEKSQGRGSYPTQMNSLQILCVINENFDFVVHYRGMGQARRTVSKLSMYYCPASPCLAEKCGCPTLAGHKRM